MESLAWKRWRAISPRRSESPFTFFSPRCDGDGDDDDDDDGDHDHGDGDDEDDDHDDDHDGDDDVRIFGGEGSMCEHDVCWK